MKLSLAFVGFLLFTIQAHTQVDTYWEISDQNSILWRPQSVIPLPHRDNIEMAGKKIAAIIYYQIDEEYNLQIRKDLIFPQLRTYNKTNEPEWKKYRAYFRKEVGNEMAPSISLGEKIIVPSKIDSIEIGGMISFFYQAVEGLQITKRLYPSMEERFLVEEWSIQNTTNTDKYFSINAVDFKQSQRGYKGDYTFVVKSDAKTKLSLGPHETYSFPVYFGALLNDEKINQFNFEEAFSSRLNFLQICQNNLVLESPNPVLNTLFYFSKIRAAESIFHSSMGLVHSPGGGNYYVGIWANDQIEYSGPYFPYLGYATANEAAYNAYKMFAQNIPQDGSHIPYAFEVDGNFHMDHLDRGDAAMIAYGCSLYLLNCGDEKQANTLWPLIEWSLDYCHNHRNDAGAVISESDEMEGRIPTGDANLSTSTLYYGGLKYSIALAKSLGKLDQALTYLERYEEMEQVIEDYFGANMEGLETYRYFDGNEALRHWICLPLTMGIKKRREGTLRALFDKLWTDNGVLVQYDPNTSDEEQMFWDRATLYALKGAFKMGASKTALERLIQYSTKRLLGDHVPYPVEAYPENNMKHLSAESALYGRIFLEGILGLEPNNLSTISITPQLPEGWDFLHVKNIYLLNRPYDLHLTRMQNGIQLRVQSQGKPIYVGIIKSGNSFGVTLK